MQDIESLVMQNYEKSMLYFQLNHIHLFNKLKALEQLLGEGKYPQKYDLEYKNGYFDVVELASGGFLYNTDSNAYSQRQVEEINLKKNEHVIETFYNQHFDEESVKNAKKLTAEHNNATTAPIIDYYNKNIDKSMLMKRIHKFMFLGVGLGLHIKEMTKKVGADVYFILEDDIELFRLSLFTCNYQEAFAEKKAVFGIAQNREEFENSFIAFYNHAFIRNHYLKFSLFSSKDEVYIKKLQVAILSMPEHAYPHSALLIKSARILNKLKEDYKFFSMLKKNEKFFDNRPIMVLGAGPSLGANKEWLKQHHKNFIIIAPFATLRILFHLDIAPDIIVQIDEGSEFANRDIKLYEGKEDFFKNSLFIFNASIHQLFFDTFDKDSIYLIEDRTKYKLNDNHIEIASVGETVYAIALSLTNKDIYMLGLDMAVSDDGSSHSKTHSTKNKVDILSADRLEDAADIRKTVLQVKGNFRDKVPTIPLFNVSIALINLQTTKYKSKDQNIYNLSNGAYFQETIPLKIEAVEFKNKEEQKYGAVKSEYGITFTGYYKRVNSSEIYDVDVYLNGKQIDKIRADKRLKKAEELFDVSGNGFEFILEEKYFDKHHLLEFKESKSGKLLMDGAVNTISVNDEKFNEYKFMDSLEHEDVEKMKDMYCPNAIGFLATEDNLADLEFVEYINQIIKDFSSSTFKALVFDRSLENEIKNKFPLAVLEILELSSISIVYNNIEVYLSNNQRNALDTQILINLREYSTNIFGIGIGLNRKVSIRQQESNQLVYFDKFFNNLKYLGFDKQDIEKYGNSFHEVYFKKASEKYNVDIDFNLDESISKAYVYWNLKLGLANHKFFKESLVFGKKFAKLQ